MLTNSRSFLMSLFHCLLRCDNREQCEISADEFDFGSNPCPDTERYLEAHYVCVRKQSSPATGELFFLIVDCTTTIILTCSGFRIIMQFNYFY